MNRQRTWSAFIANALYAASRYCSTRGQGDPRPATWGGALLAPLLTVGVSLRTASGQVETIVARKLSTPFFSEHSVFDRGQYASAVGRETGDHVVCAMLTQHLKAGNIRRISRGLFASVPKGADATTWPVDRFLAASRLRRGGVIVYHSALELLGYAYSNYQNVQVAAPGGSNVRRTADFTCRFVKSSAAYGPDDLQTVDRLGQGISVTTLECTIADLFDRPVRAGGLQELIQSLELVKQVSFRPLIARLVALDNPAAAGAAGLWLENNADRLGISNAAITRLRSLAPPRTALHSEPRRAPDDCPASAPMRVLSSVDGPCSASVKLVCSDDLSGCGHLSGLLARR
jgi:predicted transcriptional regulator of viral defense system